MKIVLEKTKKGEYGLDAAFAASISLLMMKNIVINGSATLYNSNSILNITVAIVSLFLYVYAILFVNGGRINFTSKQLHLFAIIFLFWGMTFVFNRSVFEMSYTKEGIVYFFVNCLPALVVLPSINSCKNLMIRLYRIRWIFFLVTSITVVLMAFQGHIQSSSARYYEYSMSFGRALILPSILFFSYWKKEGNVMDLVGGSILVLYILLYGSRFPLLCVASFIIWKYYQNKDRGKKIALLVFMIVIVSILVFVYKDLMRILVNIMDRFGVTSRTLSLFATAQIGYDSDRLVIWNVIIKKVNKSPIFGYGAFGGNYVTENGLPHSFIMDVFASCGYLLGGIIILYIMNMIVKLYKKNNCWYDREFVTMCICEFLPICMIQLSIWTAIHLWFLIALSVGSLNSSNESIDYSRENTIDKFSMRRYYN